jgi:hippurate hydrolase
MKSLKELIQHFLPDAIKIRQTIHAHPELSNDEIKTSALVAHTLQDYGYEVTTGVGGTGVGGAGVGGTGVGGAGVGGAGVGGFPLQ